MKSYRLLVLTMLCGGIGMASCSDYGGEPLPTQPPADPGISFQAHIRPSLQTYCASCHGGSGGFSVGSVQDIRTTGDHQPNVMAGDGSGSNLVLKLSASPPFGDRMPQGGPYFSAAFVDTIKLWIDQGAKDN